MGWLLSNKEQAKALDEIKQTHSDRATAIVVAALLEANLRRAIEIRLRTGDDDNLNKLFKPSGPLGPFETKATLAYLMEAIDADTLSDLTCVSWMRNRFAHSIEPLKFDSREIRKRCEEIKIVEAPEYPTLPGKGAPPQLSYSRLPAKASPRERFLLAAQLLTIVLFRSAHDYVIGPTGRAVRWVQVPADGRAT